MRFLRVNNPEKQFYNSDFNNFFNHIDTIFPAKSFNDVAYNNIPAVSVKEGETEFEVAAPSLRKEDFKLGIHQNRLAISVKHEKKIEEKKGKFSRQEFNYSSFQHAFTLPKNVDCEKISASYKDGILHVKLPKKEELKPATKEIIVF
jgi:HSP20 family protein